MKIRILYVTAVAILFGLGLALLLPDGTAQEEQAPVAPPVEAPAKRGNQETDVAPAPAAEEPQTILATLGSEPVDYYGPCPAKITFVGTISVTRPCELHYRFIRSDGETSPVKAMNFVTAASREVMTSWQVEKDYAGWQILEVLKPQEVESNKAHFTVKCEGAADAVQPEEAKDVSTVPAEVMDDDPAAAEDDAGYDAETDVVDPSESVQVEEQEPASGEAVQKVESIEERVAKLEERVAKLEEAKEKAKEPTAPELPVAAAEEPAAAPAPPPTPAPPVEPKKASAPAPARRVTKLVIRGEPEPEEKEAVKEPEEKVEETPRPAYQYYMISGTPLGAEINEGEVLHGTAPMTLRLSSEKHLFTFTKDGYKDETRELGVSPGGWIEVKYNLEPEVPPSETEVEPETPPAELEVEPATTPLPDA